VGQYFLVLDNSAALGTFAAPPGAAGDNAARVDYALLLRPAGINSSAQARSGRVAPTTFGIVRRALVLMGSGVRDPKTSATFSGPLWFVLVPAALSGLTYNLVAPSEQVLQGSLWETINTGSNINRSPR